MNIFFFVWYKKITESQHEKKQKNIRLNVKFWCNRKKMLIFKSQKHKNLNNDEDWNSCHLLKKYEPTHISIAYKMEFECIKLIK